MKKNTDMRILKPLPDGQEDTPMPLKWLNKFIEQQDGRCIRCNELFEHCGGSEEHSVLIPRLSSISYTIGVVCAACLDGINQELSDFCILNELKVDSVKAVTFKHQNKSTKGSQT